MSPVPDLSAGAYAGQMSDAVMCLHPSMLQSAKTSSTMLLWHVCTSCIVPSISSVEALEALDCVMMFDPRKLFTLGNFCHCQCLTTTCFVGHAHVYHQFSSYVSAAFICTTGTSQEARTSVGIYVSRTARSDLFERVQVCTLFWELFLQSYDEDRLVAYARYSHATRHHL